MANDYYSPVSVPVEFSRARAGRVGGEFLNVEEAFDAVPEKNALYGNAQILAEEADNSGKNAIVLRSNYPLSSLIPGQMVHWLAERTNDDAATLKVDLTASKDLVGPDHSELEEHVIRAGWMHGAIYNGEAWILMNPAVPIEPELSLKSRVQPLDLLVDEAMDSVTLSEALGGTSPYTYSIVETLPAGLSFAADTRVLSGTPTAIADTLLTYKVVDSETEANELRQRFLVRVLETVLSIADPENQQMTVGSSQSFQLPAATGGEDPYAYSINGLPPGLSFDPAPNNRIVSGVPSTAGTYSSVQYTVTDNNGVSVTKTFQIFVRSNTALTLPGVENRTYTRNEAIADLVLPEASGGLPGYSYAVSGLPTGLSFDAATRTISGTPTALGSGTEVTYTVTDQNSLTSSVEFTVDVIEGGRRYVFVYDSGATITSAIIASGNNFDVDETSLKLPSWTGAKRIGIAQPATRDDLTYISLSGLGNALSAFTKDASTVTIGTTSYEFWGGDEDQGGAAIGGSFLNVRP